MRFENIRITIRVCMNVANIEPCILSPTDTFHTLNNIFPFWADLHEHEHAPIIVFIAKRFTLSQNTN